MACVPGIEITGTRKITGIKEKFQRINTDQNPTMKLPTEIADIIACFGTRKLTFSEKRKLLLWYRQLGDSKESQLSNKEAALVETRILGKIMDYIEKHSSSKKNNSNR